MLPSIITLLPSASSSSTVPLSSSISIGTYIFFICLSICCAPSTILVFAQVSHDNYTLPVQLSWNGPNDIITDPDLNIYVIDIKTTVFKYAPNGTEIGCWRLANIINVGYTGRIFTIDSHQNVYYSNNASTIVRYNLQTGDLMTYPEIILTHYGMNFQVDANGNLYLFTEDGLSMFNSLGAFTNITTPYSSLQFPFPYSACTLLYTDPNLNIYCFIMYGDLCKFSTNGTLVYNIPLNITGSIIWYGGSAGRSGMISFIMTNRLISVSSTGAVIANVSIVDGNFRGEKVIVDDANNVYVLSIITARIYKFTSALQLVDQWTPKYLPIYGVKSIVVDSTFNIYVLWYKFTNWILLWKVNPNGEIIANTVLDLHDYSYLELDPRTENLVIKSKDNPTLVFFDRDLHFIDSIHLPVSDDYTYGPNGLLYDFNYTNIINVYNTTNNYSMTSIRIPFYAYNRNLAIDRENSIYIFGGAGIIKLNSDGRTIAEFNISALFGSNLFQPNLTCSYTSDIKIDSQSNMYVSNGCDLCAMTSAGVPITCFASPSSFRYPRTLWIDSLDRIYSSNIQYFDDPLEPFYVFNSILNASSLSSSSSSSSSTAMASSSLAMSSSQSLLSTASSIVSSESWSSPMVSSSSSSSTVQLLSSSSSSLVISSSSIDSSSTIWTSSISSSDGSISSGISSSSSGNNGTDPFPDDGDNSALSSSILIGIIVAGSVLPVVIIVFAVWYFRKRRLSNQNNYNDLNSRNDIEMNSSLLKPTAYF